ncbi:MAG: hypothetical protein DRH51_03565 [Candidatus Coatesbacteria bacterium]|nr:MAG: hypothetical protein DRH51_03565 [Candidatus Coatesbacteria bacterium]
MDIRKFWGKKSKNKDSNYHPLIFHSIDVGNIALMLWQNVFSDRYRARIAKKLGINEDKLGCWVAFWASLHDLGKVSPTFQRMDERKKCELKKCGYDFPLLSVGKRHEVLTEYILTSEVLTGRHNALLEVLSKILGAHHGIYHSQGDKRDINCRHLGNNEGWKCSRKEFYNMLLNLFKPPDISNIQEPLNPGDIVFLTGLVTVADWIASNEDYFPFTSEEKDVNEYFKESQETAEDALTKSGWLPRYKLKNKPESFQGIFDFKVPRDLQKGIINIFNDNGLPDFLLLEWPTGEGKTEASFWATANWLVENTQQGLYVALPTRATSDQMWKRTGKFLKKLFPDMNIKVGLIHGLSQLVMEESKNINFVDEGDEVINTLCDIESWFYSKKKALLQQFGVGTIDQALFGVLQVKHFYLRLFGLAGKTVILDEVHAYDTYTTDLMVRLIEWLSALDTRVILLSATLPSDKRKELICAYAGREIDIDNIPYPASIALYGDEIKKISKKVSKQNQYKLGIDWIKGPNPDLSKFINQELKEGGCAVVILNSIKRAQETYKQLKGNLQDGIEVQLLHSRFPYEDRKNIEDGLLRKYGPPNEEQERPQKSVLVSTQVVEQSMDLDFDVMISDIAPIDLLLQRAGRLHRHDRGERKHDRKLWIIEPEIVDGIPKVEQNAYVYRENKYIVLKTWRILKERENKNNISIPDDIPSLINSVYCNNIDIDDELKESYKMMLKNKKEDEQQSLNFKIPPPYKPSNYILNINNYYCDDDPTIHKTLKAATRKGDNTIQIICLRSEVDEEKKLYDEIMNNHNPSEKLPERIVKKLLKRTCSVSSGDLILRILREWSFRESPLRKTGVIRYHIPLLFEKGINENFSGYRLLLNDDLGLLLETEGDSDDE